MSEKECLAEMLKLAEHLRDKLKRPDCKRAYEILNQEIGTIKLRIEHGI